MANPNLLSPNSRTAAEAAWERAQEKREAWPFGSSATYQSLGAASLHTLDAAVATARERGAAGFDGLNGITNLETRELFKRDLEDYKTIFAGAGIDMPTPAELAEGGIDFGRLAELKEELPDHDLVVAPLVLPINTVRQLVSAVAQDKTVPNNPLGIVQTQTREKSDGLFAESEVTDCWDRMINNTVAYWGLPIVEDDYKWTAFLLLNNDDQDRLIPYEQAMKEGRMPTPVTSYVAYQLHRIHQAMSPMDSKEWVITSNEFASSEGSASVLKSCFSNSGNDIMIRCTSIEFAKTFVKVRPLVG